MASKNNSSDETISDINIVPLVDIILVVLIIFMVTAPAMINPSVEVDLPSAASGDSTEPSLLNVMITLDGRVFVNNEEVDEERVRKMAQQEFEKSKDTQAVISADQGANYGFVIQVIDWIKSTGIKNFAVTTERQGG
ncbi:MAG TPA: biopolymer transporter ExbD [Pseudobdellovibrionaceae bacterium]|nr:biopolymer transporter ExbD [Pseudobdellovibrionaceae bacterium]